MHRDPRDVVDLGNEEIATCRGDDFQVSSTGRFRNTELSNFSSSSRLREALAAIGTITVARTDVDNQGNAR